MNIHGHTERPEWLKAKREVGGEALNGRTGQKLESRRIWISLNSISQFSSFGLYWGHVMAYFLPSITFS
jgi:hypothetical protein